MRLRIAVAILSAALAAGAPAAAPTVKAGVEAWQRGDHAEATAIWRNLAEKGDADAAFNLGQAFRLGRGVPADSAQAKKWFEAAANKGHVDAQVSLGLLLFDSGDRPIAMSWLKKAALTGEARALLIVGTALFNGEGLKQDPVLGYAYVSRASAQGLEAARSTLAEMDKIMTLEERKRGVALALEMAKAPAAKPAAKAASPKAATTKVTESRPEKAKPSVAILPTNPPPPMPKEGGPAYRIQLGAFSTRGAAQALFAKLEGRLGGVVRPAYVPVGSMTRLQVGPYIDRAAATAACARLKPHPCFAVPIK